MEGAYLLTVKDLVVDQAVALIVIHQRVLTTVKDTLRCQGRSIENVLKVKRMANEILSSESIGNQCRSCISRSRP